MASISQRFVVVALGIALNIGALGIEPKQANAQSYQYNFTTRYATTTTNGQGYFSVNHGLGANHIWSISVAIQHANGNWHTLEYSNSVDNRFWWNDTSVQGVINSPNFYNKPVRILLVTY
jgi:hypothetical protein